MRPLGGGISEATDAISIDDASGRRHRLVLQRWIRPGWEIEDPGFGPAKEAAVLNALAPTAIPAPDLVAVDPDGSSAGVPALLTERLRGHQPTAAFVARHATLRVLGEKLAEIHRIGVDLADDPELRRLVPAYEPFGDLADAVIPPSSSRPDLWHLAIATAGERASGASRGATLLHRDYHAWNTLWVGDLLTGIVDWTSASWGPPAADLAHFRVDLVVDVSVEAAVRARAAFKLAGGDLRDARRHQLRTVFDYLTDTEVDTLKPAVVARLDAFLELVIDEPDD